MVGALIANMAFLIRSAFAVSSFSINFENSVIFKFIFFVYNNLFLGTTSTFSSTSPEPASETTSVKGYLNF